MTLPATPVRLRRFSLLYAVANVGAFICFVPLIGLVLPQQAMALSADGGIRLLSWLLLAGAVVASLANIGAGWLSDRTLALWGTRLPMVGLGLVATLISLAILTLVDTPSMLIAGFLFFQLCFNMLFAPFNALATDHIPDATKGRMFGLLSMGLPLSQLAIIAIIGLDIESLWMRLAVIAALASTTMLPLLWLGPGLIAQPTEASGNTELHPEQPLSAFISTCDFMLAWSGRLLIQCAAVCASSYLLVHLTGLADRQPTDGSAEIWFGRLSAIALIIGLITGIAIGRWSDTTSRRRPFLWATACCVAVGCGAVGLAESWNSVVVGYALFAIGLSGYLTIDSAVIAQIVGTTRNRASWLGIMNLTNTLPSLLVPGLALIIDGAMADTMLLLFMCVSTGALIAAALAAMIRSVA